MVRKNKNIFLLYLQNFQKHFSKSGRKQKEKQRLISVFLFIETKNMEMSKEINFVLLVVTRKIRKRPPFEEGPKRRQTVHKRGRDLKP